MLLPWLWLSSIQYSRAAGGETKSLSYFTDNLSVKAVTAYCLLELAQISSQELDWWRLLWCHPAVSCANAGSNSYVTELASGLVISSVDYSLTLMSLTHTKGGGTLVYKVRTQSDPKNIFNTSLAVQTRSHHTVPLGKGDSMIYKKSEHLLQDRFQSDCIYCT